MFNEKNAILLSYINTGFALVPIPNGSKGPRTSKWNYPENTITNENAISKITGNVGLAHAYSTPAPTCTLDIDDLNESRIWLLENNIELISLLEAQDAVCIDSGRTNRAKLLYRLEVGEPAIPSVKYSIREQKQALFELRCGTKDGKTVQDVLPPSIHPETGKPYQWGGQGHYTQIPKLPAALRALWETLLASNHHGNRNQIPENHGLISNTRIGIDKVTQSLIGEPETPRAIAIVKEMLSFINADCDYETYRNIIWAVADTGWECSYGLLKDWSLTAEHRFEEDELQKIFNGFKYTGGIHYGTLVHHAKAGGWNG
jgi:putative DNA primase/helicase